ncbi:MAG: Cytochrome c biogenesis protein transmembrane region [Thermotoga sp. 50_1627]|uniref:cytochrome c biogenesis CcdA family protein n=1 Tax=Pseudothermotoga sp. TaxID=2033661 RepID=UPI00076D7DDB|nr:MAG: Cytochrome c biogenesis protein transmembrane region [Thermotoga sp. 50_64]KUK25315.1 MAG: Cytochrome c biogenesis protein transmembrane region [Thermotoga sp. 50_1627]MBC7116998.1 cytochrome c biogenesis protein CcdA [Pseudothermotoga sp.]MDK2923028.1 cytochrome c-type biosis protein [Pseudothermotoga sp.]HBT39901.1 cytochrome c biogenesis protein CcdA [Pseudothermotoga sp.]
MVITVTQVDIWTALVHGLISFLSPCALPLLPSFIALLLYDKGRNAFFRIMGFFLGLSATFSILGALSGAVGGFLNKNVLRYVSGTLIIAMGVLFLLQVQLFKPTAVKLNKLAAGGILSGIGLGLGVGMVWIPCASPVLASILAIAATKGTALKGAVLLFIYSLGISVPFLTIGGFVSKLLTKVSFGTPLWERILKYGTSALLFLIGSLIIAGKAFV